MRAHSTTSDGAKSRRCSACAKDSDIKPLRYRCCTADARRAAGRHRLPQHRPVHCEPTLLLGLAIHTGGAGLTAVIVGATWRRATPISAPGALTRIGRSMGVLLCLVAGTRCRSSTTRCAHVGVPSVVCWALLDFVNHFREAQVLAAEARLLSLADSLSAPLHRLASHCGVVSFVAVCVALAAGSRTCRATCRARKRQTAVRHLSATCAPMPTLHC
jgi:hypothetical protein